MVLSEILYGVDVLALKGSTALEIENLSIDSRENKLDRCFFAIKGTLNDGHDFIKDAIEHNAVAVICENIPEEINEKVVYVKVKDSATATGIMAHNFYGHPTTKLKLVGVTGTNGKTTVATLLHQLFTALGFTCGLISTVQNQVGNTVIKATHTTPDAISLNAMLAQMLTAGCTHVFMECSSHAIHQKRLSGLQFSGALFTNITHDHLDYHNTFEEYIRVKKSWFDVLPKTAFAITNLDDKRGNVMLQNTAAKKYFYSLQTLADFKGKILDNSLQGLHMMINETEVYFKMIGGFNASNLLAVYGAAICLGEEKTNVLLQLSKLTGAEGRFDFMVSDHEKVVGIVDYAHTPDALLNILATIKNLRQGPEKIITVVGCGGSRDKTKRPVMGQVACEHSDRVIFTSDNPRNENPDEIIKEIEAGVGITARKKYISIADRREAIKTAVSFSQKEDIILIAGKGHEKYQEIKGVKNEFDDKQVLREMFELMEK